LYPADDGRSTAPWDLPAVQDVSDWDRDEDGQDGQDGHASQDGQDGQEHRNDREGPYEHPSDLIGGAGPGSEPGSVPGSGPGSGIRQGAPDDDAPQRSLLGVSPAVPPRREVAMFAPIRAGRGRHRLPSVVRRRPGPIAAGLMVAATTLAVGTLRLPGPALPGHAAATAAAGAPLHSRAPGTESRRPGEHAG
jgi:hypothetical protein